MLSLPGLHLEWEDVTVPPGSAFAQWNVYRRPAATTDAFGDSVAAGSWTRIAVIESQATLEYDDFNTEDEIEYEYAVTWIANTAGTLLESDKQADPPGDAADYPYAWLHRLDDPAKYCLVRPKPSASYKPQQGIEFADVRGRETPTAFIDENEATRIGWPLRIEDYDGDVWPRLRAMLAMQKDEGAIFCFRPAYARERYFVNIADLTRDDDPTFRSSVLTLQETFYEESV